MHLDWTIRLGDIITILSIVAAVLFSGVRAVKAFRERMSAIEAQIGQLAHDFELVWSWFKNEHNLGNGRDRESLTG